MDTTNPDNQPPTLPKPADVYEQLNALHARVEDAYAETRKRHDAYEEISDAVEALGADYHMLVERLNEPASPRNHSRRVLAARRVRDRCQSLRVVMNRHLSYIDDALYTPLNVWLIEIVERVKLIEAQLAAQPSYEEE